MAKQYSFTDLMTYTGASRSECTNWVQKGIIRPDIKDTRGTGVERVFGILDVFEAKIAKALNQLPGGMPTAKLSVALVGVRFHCAFPGTDWNLFLDPKTRNPTAQFWLGYTPGVGFTPGPVTTAERDALFSSSRAAMIVLPLHGLLVDLERDTHDYITAAEAARAFGKEKPRDRKRRNRAIGEMRA